MWSIITGKRYKDNQLSAVLDGPAIQAFERLCGEGLIGTNKAFGAALIAVVLSSGQLLFRESGIPEFIAVGRNPKQHDAALLKFAAFMAGWLHERWVDRNQEAIVNENGEIDDAGRSLLRDLTYVRETLFPDKDPQVQEAIARAKANDVRALELIPQGRSAEVNEEWWLIIASLMDLSVPNDDEPMARRERTFAVAGVQVAALDGFSRMFDELVNDPTLMR